MKWTRENALAYRAKIERAAESQTDEQAIESIELFPKWVPDMDILAGRRYREGDKLYKALQSHRSQADWRPSVTPALFVEVEEPGEIREITDPIPAEYPFMKGELGRWKGEVYESNIDNNVWTPDAYPGGWNKKS